jgi:hypothetical protein
MQLLNLLEVVMLNAETQINQAKLDASSEKPSGPENAVQDRQDNTDVSESSGAKSNADDSNKTTVVDNQNILEAVLQSLPQPELRLLCSLLAHDGYAHALSHIPYCLLHYHKLAFGSFFFHWLTQLFLFLVGCYGTTRSSWFM